MEGLRLCCPACHLQLEAPPHGTHTCACGQTYESRDGALAYEWKPLLYERYRTRFLLNSVLNNNGYLSYQLLPEGSISLPDRADVVRFREYLQARAVPGTLLDVGCGPMELPGYLAFDEAARGAFRLVGLDPIAATPFAGALRIVGCAEFLPLCAGSVETIVFATSLDHVCDLRRTLAETRRVISAGGVVVLWTADVSTTVRSRLRPYANRVRDLLAPVRQGGRPAEGRHGRYHVYPDLTVMYVPRGAADPYHARLQDVAAVVREFQRLGFTLEHRGSPAPGEAFLTFRPVS